MPHSKSDCKHIHALRTWMKATQQLIEKRLPWNCPTPYEELLPLKKWFFFFQLPMMCWKPFSKTTQTSDALHFCEICPNCILADKSLTFCGFSSQLDCLQLQQSASVSKKKYFWAKYLIPWHWTELAVNLCNAFFKARFSANMASYLKTRPLCVTKKGKMFSNAATVHLSNMSKTPFSIFFHSKWGDEPSIWSVI